MSEPPKREERDLNEFWWKIGSVAIAVMVWFIITTVAGTGTNGVSGDRGLAIQAKLSGVTGVAVDTTGNVYFTSINNQRVRKVTAATGYRCDCFGLSR